MPNNDSHHHVVKTSEQWNERAVEFWVVPRGCLCVELTPKGKTKIKIGEGNKYYSQLPYITDESDLSNYYTKIEIDNLFDNLQYMSIRSTEEYDEKSDLPDDGNKLGDVRFVKSQSPSIKPDPDVYLWNGTRWVFVGYEIQNIDLSDYLKKDEFHLLFDPVKEQVDEMYPKMHTHENKSVLDQITAPYTIPEKEKLAGLENYDDSEIRQLIHDTGHTHPNKNLLDSIVDSMLWSQSDRDKFDSLHNYDDTQVVVRIQTLESLSHTHDNKTILDNTTASFTIEDKTKLDSLENAEVFIGTDGMYAGKDGLVPGPTIADAGKFLSADGTWRESVVYEMTGATATTDGVSGLVPTPLTGDENKFLRGDGTWATVESGGGSDVEYRGGDGIDIIDISNNYINYIRFEITKIRTNTGSIVQYSEIEFYDGNDNRLTINSATAIFSNGTAPVWGEMGSTVWRPNYVYDNRTDTKMVVINWARVSLYTDLHLTVPVERKNLKSYKWYTGNDATERDPVSWRLFVSSDGENWELIDTQNDVAITTSRQSASPIFPIDLNNNPVVKSVVNTGLLSVEQSQQDPNTLTFETVDGDIDVTIPTYTLPVATTTTLGGIKVGAGLSMNSNDELEVAFPYVTSVTNKVANPGVVTVSKSDGTSSDVDILDDIGFIFNCNFDSTLTQNVLGEPVDAPVSGQQIGSPIMGDLTVLEVNE